MNIALFTSNHLRHKFIANAIHESLGLQLIVSEEKSQKIEEVSNYSKEEAIQMSEHFKQRDFSEKKFFGEHSDFPKNVCLLPVKFGKLNSTDVLSFLKDNCIDYIVLFGSSIVKDEILSAYPNKVINMHLGLSPYYKGSGTNFFPILNNEFSCIGATIHLAVLEVDAGAILHQFRLGDVRINDSIHDLGNKIIQLGGLLYPLIIKSYIRGLATPKKQMQIKTSKIYKVKDFTPEALSKAKQDYKIRLETYLNNKSKLDKNFPIIDFYEK